MRMDLESFLKKWSKFITILRKIHKKKKNPKTDVVEKCKRNQGWTHQYDTQEDWIGSDFVEKIELV